MKRHRHLLFLFCILVAFSNLPSTYAQQRRRAANANSDKKVRLVVGIVIDQFRADYLTRFEDQFGEGGFKRLLRDGANFSDARYIHTPTYTACGHATFMSGATPAHNGIIGNEWFDRESGKRVTSVSDSKVKLLGIGEGATTTHGTPYGYDTHVPVIFFGAGVAAGSHHVACSPADIAPTLAALLKIETPSNSIGRVLTEAIKTK